MPEVKRIIEQCEQKKKESTKKKKNRRKLLPLLFGRIYSCRIMSTSMEENNRPVVDSTKVFHHTSEVQPYSLPLEEEEKRKKMKDTKRRENKYQNCRIVIRVFFDH